jgi:hypothetical protein
MTKVTLTLKTIGSDGANEKVEAILKMPEKEALAFFDQSLDLRLRTIKGALFQGHIGQVSWIQYDEMKPHVQPISPEDAYKKKAEGDA